MHACLQKPLNRHNIMSVIAMPTCGGESRRQRFLFLLDTTRQSPTRTLQVGCMQPPHGDCGRRQAAAPTHGHPRATRCGADAQSSYRAQARKGHKAADKQAKGTDFQASCRSFGRKAVQQCSGIRRSKPNPNLYRAGRTQSEGRVKGSGGGAKTGRLARAKQDGRRARPRSRQGECARAGN